MGRNAVSETWKIHTAVEFFGWNRCESNNENIRIAIDDFGPRVMPWGKCIDNLPKSVMLNSTFDNWYSNCKDCDGKPAGYDSARRIETYSELEFCITLTAVTKFGHAIGLIHEQARPEGDRF